MPKYIIKRVLAAIFTLFIIATVTFFLMQLLPGGPFVTERATEKTIQMMNEQYGLNDPVPVQYGRYMANLLRGNLGMSLKRLGFSVNEIIGEKFPVSARVGAVAVCIAIIGGLPLGILAAIKRNSVYDRLIMFLSTIGIAVPGFVLAAVLQYFLGMRLGILPSTGLKSPLSYIMPAFTLAFYPMCYIARLMRSSMLEVLGQDYIKTATSKGLSRASVIFKHSLRNSVLPIITYVGPMIASVLTGGFVVETVFNIPGLGKYFIESIRTRDYPMIMGTTVFLAALVVLANLLVDLVYSAIDPRIKLE